MEKLKNTIQNLEETIRTIKLRASSNQDEVESLEFCANELKDFLNKRVAEKEKLTESFKQANTEGWIKVLKKAAKENDQRVFQLFAELVDESEQAKEELRRKGYGHIGLSLLRIVVDEVPESNSNPKESDCGCTINQACKACAQSKGINWDFLWDYSAQRTI